MSVKRLYDIVYAHVSQRKNVLSLKGLIPDIRKSINLERFEKEYRESKLKLHNIALGKECELNQTSCHIRTHEEDKIDLLKYYYGIKSKRNYSVDSGYYLDTTLTSLQKQDSCCHYLNLVPICECRGAYDKGGLIYDKITKNSIYIDVINIYLTGSLYGYHCYIECRPSKRRIRNLQALIIPLIRPKVSLLDPLIKEAYGIYAEDMSPEVSTPIIKSDRLKRKIISFFKR